MLTNHLAASVPSGTTGTGRGRTVVMRGGRRWGCSFLRTYAPVYNALRLSLLSVRICLLLRVLFCGLIGITGGIQ